MTNLLNAITISLITFTAWRHWLVARFFRRARTHPHPPGTPPRLVSILQPILSGDPTLPQTLAHNLAARSTYAREFLWLVDADDKAGQAICTALIAAHPASPIRLLLQPAPPQGVNPKTFKLVNGLAAARGDVICVLDDDTMLPDDGLEQCLPYLDQPGRRPRLWTPLPGQLQQRLVGPHRPLRQRQQPADLRALRVATRTRHDQRHVLRPPPPRPRPDGRLRPASNASSPTISPSPNACAATASTSSRPPCATPSARRCPSLRRYLSLMQRWFIFPRESLLRHLPWREQALVYALALAPTLLPPLLLLGRLLWPSPLLATAPGPLLRLSYAAFLHLDHAYLGHPTPTAGASSFPVLQIVFPLQLLTALLLPQRITWRGHIMQVERGGGFRFVKRR